MGKILFIVIVVLVIGAFIIASARNIDFKEDEDRGNFVKAYFSWLLQLGRNMKQLTVHAIKLDWMPAKNITNESNSS